MPTERARRLVELRAGFAAFRKAADAVDARRAEESIGPLLRELFALDGFSLSNLREPGYRTDFSARPVDGSVPGPTIGWSTSTIGGADASHLTTTNELSVWY